MATRLALAMVSLSSWIRFGASSTVTKVSPVTLPPGRARLLTKPSATGSPPPTNTIGISIRRLRRGERLWWANREDDVNAILDKLRRELRKTLLLPFRIAPLNEEIFALSVTEIPKTLSKRREEMRTAGRQTELNVPDLDNPLGLLCVRRNRPPRRRAAESRDEFAPPHSITSSARASSDGGTVEAERLGGLEIDRQARTWSAPAPADRPASRP